MNAFIIFVTGLLSTVTTGDFRKQGKGYDNGVGGDFFEAMIKLFIGNTRGAVISKMGQQDTRKLVKDGNNKVCGIAIKSGYGCLFHINREGEPISKEFTGTVYTIWAGDPLTPPEKALVVRTEDILNSEILREVWGTCMYARHTNPDAERGEKVPDAYKNQINFKSNKLKVDLEMNRMAIATLAEFKAKYLK